MMQQVSSFDRVRIACRVLGLLGVILCPNMFGQSATGRYALILDTPAVAANFEGREAVASRQATDYQAQLEARHQDLRTRLAQRRITVTSSVSTVLNAVFVIATPDQVADLKTLPGVIGVVPLRRYKLKLNLATQLMNAPAAWTAVGGAQNAGSGVKIAILDSGIEQTSPSLQDPTLQMPAGFPICTGDDCAFTSNKVIVARSYVRQLAAGTGSNPAVDSRPDDYSPRDRVGHGTAVASVAAGVTTTGGTVTFSGMAPKAYLGNYKIYGSPGLNDGTTEDIIIQALEDAFHDGMDVISFSSGLAAFSGPLDTGSACGNSVGVPCDLVAQAFETVARQGVVVVAAAGNEGADGVSTSTPSYGSIDSPANAPSVIAAAASTNGHQFLENVSVPGGDAPSNLQAISVQAGDALVPTGSLQATLLDVTQVGNDGLACVPLAPGSLVGAFALIQRGSCTFSIKLENAEDAGALGAVFYMSDASATFGPAGLSNFVIPAVMISNADGLALKDFFASHRGHAIVINPASVEQSAVPNEVIYFSSVGPGTGDAAAKPDLLAVGTNVYMAGETFDPAGVLYSSSGFTVADGTSFSTPMTSGAAALVKQKHPQFSSLQIKSALVNTASPTVVSDNFGNTVDVRSTGAGKLDAGAAAKATVTIVPSVISFGMWNGSRPGAIPLTITNTGSAPVALTLKVVAANSSATSAVSLDKSSFTLAAGASTTVNVSVTGSQTLGGSFSGAITLTATGLSLRVPYLYTTPTKSPANLIPLTGTFFDGQAGAPSDEGTIAVRLVDTAGAPIVGSPVTFAALDGGSFQFADSVTDVNGIAQGLPAFGSEPGSYSYSVTAGALSAAISGYARVPPVIAMENVINAASLEHGAPVAPGSYVAIQGANLSDFTDYSEFPRLPLQIDYAFVSFDVPGANLSVPAHLTYASPTQINIQVPWELQGQTSAQVKVGVSFLNGNVVTIPLSDYTPALFESGGIAAALDLNYQVITATNPIAKNHVVQLFANGLGPVTNQPESGEAALASPLSRTMSDVTVTIGGKIAQVGFSGLAPGFAGLYQVNATVPNGIGSGPQTITLSVGGKTSKISSIPVQ